MIRSAFRAFLALVLVGSTSFAGDTAYSALKLVAKRYGEEALSRVLQVRGGSGRWNVLLAESPPDAGVREVQVIDGRIRGESVAAVAQPPPVPINVNELNLDSDGALITVNQQIQKNLPERRVDYTLASVGDSNIPVWTVVLRNRPPGEVCSMQIAADTGDVLSSAVTPAAEQKRSTATEEKELGVGEGDEALAEADAAQWEEGPPKERVVRKKQTRSSSFRGPPEVVREVAKGVERGGRQLRRFLPF